MLAIFIHVSKKRISYVRLEDTAQVAHVEDVVETSAKKKKFQSLVAKLKQLINDHNRRLGIPAQGCGKQLALHTIPNLKRQVWKIEHVQRGKAIKPMKYEIFPWLKESEMIWASYF